MSLQRPRHRLRNQMMLAFAGFALLVAMLYGFYVVLFAYLVEDRFFQGLLEQEAQRQRTHHAANGDWTPPQLPFVTLHAGSAALPDGLATRLAEEPWRREFPGAQGRHYHLQPLQEAQARAPVWLVAEVSQQLVVRPMRSGIAQWLGWSALATLVLALALGAWIAHRLTAPLSRLAGLIDTALPSHLPAGFSADFPDNEVGTLARGLERMIQRVDAFVAREREFTRDASHELRTPLAVIRSACERLRVRDGLDAESRRQLDHLSQSAQQLEQTITLLLTLAREESQAEAFAEVALLPLLERVIVDQAALLGDREVEIRIEVPAGFRATLPKTVLHVVLANLIGNALAHADEGAIEIRLQGGSLQIGNHCTELPEGLFQPFVRGAASSGYGLGLAIVRRLCERHGIPISFMLEAGRSTAVVTLESTEPAMQ